jgi:hypothetical protein
MKRAAALGSISSSASYEVGHNQFSEDHNVTQENAPQNEGLHAQQSPSHLSMIKMSIYSTTIRVHLMAYKRLWLYCGYRCY